MAEKRKPVLIFLHRKPGKKTHKVELFPAALWKRSFFTGGTIGRSGPLTTHTYRMRVDGKWHNRPNGKPYAVDIWTFRDLYFKSLVPALRRWERKGK